MDKFRFFLFICFVSISSGFLQSSENIRIAEHYLFPKHEGLIERVLFVPDDPVKKILIGLIDCETKFIYGALFRLSDKDIAQAFIDAYRRGTKVRLVVDCTALEDKFEKVYWLVNAGIDIHKYRETNSTMHNKFLLFGDTLHGRQILWTGSSNTTNSGTCKNQENVIVTQKREFFATYMKKFNDLYKDTPKVKKLRYVSNKYVKQKDIIKDAAGVIKQALKFISHAKIL